MEMGSQKVDTAELSRVFGGALGKARVDVTALTGDVSTRGYFRLTCAAPQNTSYILQVSEPATSAGFAGRHFLDVAELFQEWGVRVPAVLAVDEKRGWILLEDLGDTLLQQEPTEERYLLAIGECLKWTLKSLEDPRSLPNFGWAFDETKLQAEMEFTQKHLWAGLLQHKKMGFVDSIRSNSQYLAQVPRVICHRDYHSKNLMVARGTMWVIDFQDARMGPVTYDIVSLLWDPYVRLSERSRSSLLDHWKQDLLGRLDASSELSSYLTKEKSGHPLWKIELERMKAQRMLKAAGTYAMFFMERGRTDYLPNIRPTIEEATRSLDALQKMGVATEGDARTVEFIRAIDWRPLDAVKR